MKDFCEMTGDELHCYVGKKYWARVSHRTDSVYFVESDLESPTSDLLEKKIVNLRSCIVMSRGISFRDLTGATKAVDENYPDEGYEGIGQSMA